jgi:hypothetical protein
MELSGVAEADEAIPDDFWKPVEISACAVPNALCSYSAITCAHANTFNRLRLLGHPVRCLCLTGDSGHAHGRGW